MNYVATHMAVDWDCLLSSWLILRAYPDIEQVVFIHPTEEKHAMKQATAVVDIGMQLDPTNLRFDHHQLDDPNAASASMLVYRHLILSGFKFEHLVPIVNLVDAGDTGKRTLDFQFSGTTGLHAQLWAKKQAGWTDRAVWGWASETLDELAELLYKKQQAAERMRENTVLSTPNFIAIKDATPMMRHAAHEMGFPFVLVHVVTETNVCVELWRSVDHSRFRCDQIVKGVLQFDFAEEDMAVPNELRTWFLHNGGFYAGRGSFKYPTIRPLECKFEDLALAISDEVENLFEFDIEFGIENEEGYS